jgi:hypothetical protein
MRISLLSQARPALPGRAWARALALAASMAVLAGVAGCSAGTHARHPTAAQKLADHYGGYASYLPKDTINPDDDGTLTGTSKRPALAAEGESVKVETARWSVLMTISGPEVPGEGLPFQTPATTCTWTVTMSGASRAVPISAAAFTSIDHLGEVYRTHFVPGQPRPPKVLAPGHQVTFELRAVETVGEGLMRWSPYGHSIVASWDFEVEND